MSPGQQLLTSEGHFSVFPGGSSGQWDPTSPQRPSPPDPELPAPGSAQRCLQGGVRNILMDGGGAGHHRGSFHRDMTLKPGNLQPASRSDPSLHQQLFQGSWVGGTARSPFHLPKIKTTPSHRGRQMEWCSHRMVWE